MLNLDTIFNGDCGSSGMSYAEMLDYVRKNETDEFFQFLLFGLTLLEFSIVDKIPFIIPLKFEGIFLKLSVDDTWCWYSG